MAGNVTRRQEDAGTQRRTDAGMSALPASSRPGVFVSGIVFAAYLLLTIALTYPLIARFTTHIAGGNVDEGAFLWNIWWMKHAMLDMHSNPLFTDMIFFPLGANLALYTLTLLNGILALPLTLLAGPIIAANILTIAAFALSGLGMYLLALEVLAADEPTSRKLAISARSERRMAAFIAGLLYAFASSRFLYAALGQHNLLHIQWLPLTVLFLLRTVWRPGWRSPLLAGFFAACAGLTEMNFVLFLVIWVAVFSGYVLVRWRPVINSAVAARLGLALVVFVIGFGPLGLAVVQETLRVGDYLVRGWGMADRLVIDLLGLFIPSPLHPIVGDWANRATRSFSDINFGFVGYLALLLTLIGAVSHKLPVGRQPTSPFPVSDTRHALRHSQLWFVLTLAFLILAFGPLLHINGQSEFDIDGLILNIPLPYIIIHYLPILKGARVPGRFGIMATLAAAVLVALACQVILSRVRKAGWQVALAGVLSCVVLVENMAVPLALTNVAVPEPYSTIASVPGDFSIMQIPLGWRDGFGTVGRERTLLQSYQSVHGKRILGGNTSRSPDYLLSYFAHMPVIRSIVALEEGKPIDAAAMSTDKAQAADVLSFLNVRYVVVHGDYVDGPVDKYIQATLPLQRLAAGSGQAENSFWHFDSDGRWVERRVENTAWVLYAVTSLPTRPAMGVDLGAVGAQLYLPAGWSWAETMDGITFSWAEAHRALLLLQLDQTRQTTLALRAAPFSYAGAPQQKLTVEMNGHRLGTIEMNDGWQEYRLSVPASSLRTGINHVWLRFAHLASPAQVLGSSDQRTLAVAVDWVRLE